MGEVHCWIGPTHRAQPLAGLSRSCSESLSSSHIFSTYHSFSCKSPAFNMMKVVILALACLALATAVPMMKYGKYGGLGMGFGGYGMGMGYGGLGGFGGYGGYGMGMGYGGLGGFGGVGGYGMGYGGLGMGFGGYGMGYGGYGMGFGKGGFGMGFGKGYGYGK
ncbi:keratin-associated protein 19-2-like [Gigantopelta aegis]|uniref:keratin-associated protein 19-2-like n=1 Tax=Gigantopelta aegis TaxID=1735272 RepID=UPI001B88B1BA|nr:keratin-associated protein 19-2-like [Gigantopelta aegis]